MIKLTQENTQKAIERCKQLKPHRTTRLFPLGRTAMTPGAMDALEESNQRPSEFLEKHQTGDWGAVSEFDWKENDLSVRAGFRILSAYRTGKGIKLWVITEADRSATTLLLPSEY